MNHRDRLSGQRGSALVIATIMIVITAAMIGLLLAAPQAQLAQVATSVAKQRALANADAGAREAMLVLQYKATDMQTWLPTSGANAFVSGTRGGTQTAPTGPFTPAVPASSTTFPAEHTTVATLATNPQTGYPSFAASNFRQFGDRTSSRGRFAYAIFATSQAGYYRIRVEGQALSSANATQGTNGAISSPLTVSSLIEVVAYVPNPITPDLFSAVSFTNASGGAGNPPTQPFGTAGSTVQMLETSDKQKTFVNGNMAADPNHVGVHFPQQPVGTPTPTINVDAGTPAGSTPAAGVPPTQVLSDAAIIKQYVAIADAAKTKSGGVSQTFTNGSYKLYYNRFTTGTTINDAGGYGANPLNVHGMSDGIVIFDFDDNVTIDLQAPSGTGSNIKGAFFTGNGIGSFGGTVLFVQRGRLNVTGNKMYLVAWNPANSSDNILNYNKAAINGALQTLTLPPTVVKIASYRVVQ